MANNRLNRIDVVVLGTWFVLSLSTGVALYIIYGHEVFNRWAWLRFSILTSLLSCLYTFSYRFFCLAQGDDGNNSIVYLILAKSLDFVLLYPGRASLGLHSDPHGKFLLFTILFIHGIGLYFLDREIKLYLSEIRTEKGRLGISDGRTSSEREYPGADDTLD